MTSVSVATLYYAILEGGPTKVPSACQWDRKTSELGSGTTVARLELSYDILSMSIYYCLSVGLRAWVFPVVRTPSDY